MKVSTKGRYALRLMLDLAEHAGEGFISLKTVSERQEIPVKYLEQIVSILNRAGMIKSARGNAGGYKLTRSPSSYSVGEIIRSAEGPIVPVACLEDHPNQCPRCGICNTLPLWEKLGELVNGYLDSTFLSDLLEKRDQIR